MSRKPKNPNYNPKIIMTELLDAVSACYLSAGGRSSHNTLRQVAEEFDFTHLKVRKLLITAGVYHTDFSDEILMYKQQGKTVPQIMELTGLKRAAVHSYLPYTKMVYNADELSLNAERIRRYRGRQASVQKIASWFDNHAGSLSKIVWDAMILFQEYPFHTVEGLKYSYIIKGQEIYTSRENKNITQASVDQALQKVQELNRQISDLEMLEASGASYLYPIFIRLGLICHTE